MNNLSLTQKDHKLDKFQDLSLCDTSTHKKARINSKWPVIYSSSRDLDAVNHRVLRIKRKDYKGLWISPYNKTNAKGIGGLINLFRRSKRLRSIFSQDLLRQDNNLVHACIRSLKCVKSLSLNFSSYAQATTAFRTAKIVAILRCLRCRPLFFLIRFDNKDYDQHSPTLVQALIDCIKRLRTVKALSINANYSGLRIKSRMMRFQLLQLPQSSAEQDLIQTLAAQYRRLQSLEIFSLNFDLNLHSVFRCFLQDFKAFPRLRRFRRGCLDRVVLNSLVRAVEENKLMLSAAFYPRADVLSLVSKTHDSESENIQYQWILEVNSRFHETNDIVVESNIDFDQLALSFLEREGVNLLRQSASLRVLRICIHEYIGTDLLSTFMEVLNTKQQLQDLTLSLTVSSQPSIFKFNEQMQILPKVRKLTLILTTNYGEKSPVGSFVVPDSIQIFMMKLPCLTELKLFINKLRLEDLVLLKGLIKLLPQLSSFTFGFQAYEDCDQEQFKNILAQLADILKDTCKVKRVVVATSSKPEFVRKFETQITGIEESVVANGEVECCIFKIVEGSVYRLLYNGEL